MSPAATLDRAAGAQVTDPAVAFVASRRAGAEALGARVADLVGEPDALAAALRAGLHDLSDAAYRAEQRRVAPGIGAVHGVRWPLTAAVGRGFKRATRQDRATTLLLVADRLLREEHLEAHWLAFGILERTIDGEAERTWQLLRRAARQAGDWITIDSLAHPYASGIVAEPYRWAELEQLVFSPSRWERRLVGSTIATMSHGDRRTSRAPTFAATALALLGQLIGDAAPEVQKALSWAYRSVAQRDPEATLAALRAEADLAVATRDGHRAWVIRDSLSKLPPNDAAALRPALAAIRRRPGTPSTSAASRTAAAFADLPDPRNHPEPPLG